MFSHEIYIYILTQMMCIFWWRLLNGMGEHPNENWGDQDPAVVPVSDEAPRCCILHLGEGWRSTLVLTCYFLMVFYLWNLMTPMSYEVTLIWKRYGSKEVEAWLLWFNNKYLPFGILCQVLTISPRVRICRGGLMLREFWQFCMHFSWILANKEMLSLISWMICGIGKFLDYTFP